MNQAHSKSRGGTRDGFCARKSTNKSSQSSTPVLLLFPLPSFHSVALLPGDIWAESLGKSSILICKPQPATSRPKTKRYQDLASHAIPSALAAWHCCNIPLPDATVSSISESSAASSCIPSTTAFVYVPNSALQGQRTVHA
jgi:hypothetical protein